MAIKQTQCCNTALVSFQKNKLHENKVLHCVLLCFSSDGELYAGTSVDFMGANAAIFRTSVQGSNQHYIRTEAYDHNWLNGEKLHQSLFQFHLELICSCDTEPD